MICPKCNKEILDDSIFCSACGYKMEVSMSEQVKSTRKKFDKKSIVAVGILLIVVGGVALNSTPSVKYYKAEKAYADEKYEKAIKYYTSVGDYKDATEKLNKSVIANFYTKGMQFFDEREYDEAIRNFEQAGDYENSHEMIKQCNYGKGQQYLENKEYILAAEAFYATDDYEDAYAKITQMGQDLVGVGNYKDAITVFENLDFDLENEYAQYASGMINLEENNFSKAASNFKNAGDILDATNQYTEASYKEAKMLMDSKKYSDAGNIFEKISDYKDVPDLMNSCVLLDAKKDMDSGHLNRAKEKLCTLPKDYIYGGINATELLSKLELNSQWLSICGKWFSTSGQAKSESIAKLNRMHMGTWTHDISEGDYGIQINCILNDDGTVNVSGTGTIYVCTNWSTIQIGLTSDRNREISFDKKISASDFGKAIEMDENLTMTFSTDKITLKHKVDDTNSTMSFSYYYTTDITYGTRDRAY